MPSTSDERATRSTLDERATRAFPVTFFDGRTAVRHAATLRVAGDRLRLTTPVGVPLAEWPLADVTASAEGRQGLRLARADDDGARIVVTDALARTVILAALPARAHPRRLSLTLGPVAAIVGGLAVALALAYLLAPPVARAVARAVPAAWVEPIGRQMVDSIAPPDRRCDGTAGSEALADLARRLAAGSDIPPLTVHIADLDVVNAFALPGGHVIVTRALIDGAASAEAVAGVLAHEIGHVAERHPSAAMARRLLGHVVLQLLGGGVVAEGTTLLAELSYSRDDEREADAVAVALLNRAGIDGAGLAAFMRALAGREAETGPGAIPGFLSTHPDSGERARAIARDATGTGPALSDAAWAAIRGACRGRQGEAS